MKLITTLTATIGSLCLSLASQASSIVLTNANIIDVKAQQVLSEHTLVLDNKKIIAVGKNSTVKIPENSITIDLNGKYVSPGLIDAHVHHATDPDGWDNNPDTLKRLRNLLRGGVTSVRDMGGDVRALAKLKRDAQLDVIQSPDIYYSVIIGGKEFFADPRTISSAKGFAAGTTPWMAAVDHDTNLDHVMLKALGAGATGIKIYARVDGKLMKKLSKAAKKHGLKVWSHVFVGPAKPSEAIVAGVETLSHSPDFSAEIIDDYRKWRREDQAPNPEQEKRSYQASAYSDLLAAMKAQKTILDATMVVFEQRKTMNENTAKRYRHTQLLTRLANEQGITIAAGTDAFSDDEVMLYKELALLVNDASLTPMQALTAATINNAKVIGEEHNIGSIEVGKTANLVVFDKNPAESVEHLATVAHVIKNGEFIYRGADKRLPFIPAKREGNALWMSGQLGNLPSTMALAAEDIEGQMTQTMKNIGFVLQEHGLGYQDITKCTLMLADINEWQQASKVYKSFFPQGVPTRSAFATAGLALNAKVEVECIAHF